MKRTDESPTERLLSSIESKPIRSSRGAWLLRVARQQSEVAARSLAAGRCHLGSVVAARTALARAEDAGVDVASVVMARREIDKLESTFASACVAPRPRSR